MLAAPATPATRHLIGAVQLAAMPPHAYLVNISRGDLVDQEALLKVLTDRRIAGAGLDVFEQEPPVENSPMYGLDNVFLTPHVAGASREAHLHRSLLVAHQVLQVMSGERPPHLVNPEVWDRRR